MPDYINANSIELDSNIFDAGSFELDKEEIEPVFGAGLAHTARAIAETGAGLVTGLAAFPISKGTKWIEYALSGGDLDKAKAAEERTARRIQFEPTTEEAKGAMKQIGKYVLDPFFGTLKEMGQAPGEMWNAPAIRELGGDIAELGVPYKLHKIAKTQRDYYRAKPLERPAEIPPERLIEKIEEIPAERPVDIKAEIPPEPFTGMKVEPAKIVPAESIKLDTKVEPPPVEIVQPGAVVEGKQPWEMTYNEFFWEQQKSAILPGKEGGIELPSVYVRFGRIPEAGQPSMNYLTGKSEKGVSVYKAWYDKKTGKYVLEPAQGEGEFGEFYATQESLAGSKKKPYLVTGDMRRGHGYDLEPLLDTKTARTIKELSPDDIVLADEPYVTISGKELDIIPDWSSEGIRIRDHRTEVRKALAEGKLVPPSVLKDYPEQIKRIPGATAQAVTGNPITLKGYHGTDTEFIAPNRSGLLDAVAFSSRQDIANTFAVSREKMFGTKGIVNQADIEFKNPLVIDANGRPAADWQFGKKGKETIKQIEVGGHDGLILRNTSDSAPSSGIKIEGTGDVIFVRDTNSIKSFKPVSPLPEAGGKAEGITGIKNAQTLAEREARGLSEVEVETRRSNPVAFDEGKRRIDSGEVDPRLLAEELAKKPRPLTPEETAMLTIDRQKIKTDHKAAMDSVETAAKSGDAIAEAEARVKLQDIEEIYNTNDIAARLTGYEQGAGLQARKMMIDEDYSLAAMLQKQRVDSGKPVTPEMRTKLESLNKQIEEANAKIAVYEEKASQLQASKVIERIKNEVAKEKRQVKRTMAKEELSAEFDGLVKELNLVLGGQLNVGLDPAAVVIFGKMAKNRVKSGVITVERIVDEVYTTVRNMGFDISKRDIRDAISGYGKTVQMSKEAINVQMRELRRQMRLISALEDAQAKQVPLRSGLQRDAMSDKVRELTRQVQQVMRENGIDVKATRSPEQQWKTAIQSYKTRTANRIADLEKKLTTGDFTTKPRRVTELDPEALELKFKLDKVIRSYNEAMMKDRLANRTILQKGGAGVGEAMNLSRAIKTSFDLSAVLRQGAFVAFGHPIRAAKSVPAMFKALLSEKGQFAVNLEIRSRSNYPLYEQGKLYLAEHGQKLSQMEEVYMSRWAEKISGVGASQRAYTTFLNKLRADSFDAMAANLSAKGKPTPQELNAIANYVNVATGRGNLGMKENALVGLNTVFFAPRYVASRFQLLAGQPLYRGTANTRIMIAKEYARFLTGLGVVYTLGLSAGGTVETDPRSSDFGKIKFGNTRIDPLAGLSQTTVLVGRLLSGETKTATGRIVPIRGDKVPYGSGNSADVMARFLRSKLSPVVGTGVDIAAGKDVVGQRVTAETLPEKLLMPLAINDIYETMKEQGVPATSAMAILAIFGMGLQTYDPQKRNQDTLFDAFRQDVLGEPPGSMEKGLRAARMRTRAR